MGHKLWICFLVFFFMSLIGAKTVYTANLNGESHLDLIDETWQRILEIEDPKGDDYGPGTYIYPTGEQFKPYHGLLDIEKFRIDAGEKMVRFQITFGTLTNPWKAPLGFSHQLIEIYIDHRPGGERHTFYPGARVVFSPKALWDTFIKVTGWGVYLFNCNDQRVLNPEHYDSAQVRILDDNKTIEIILLIEDWVSLKGLKNGAYYLLVGAQDGFGPDNFRVVKKEVSEWYFGGGDDSGYAPNVIDLIVPKGRDQKRILGSFDPHNQVRAVIEPVSKPAPIRKGLIYITSIVICILIWYGWHKREIFIRN